MPRRFWRSATFALSLTAFQVAAADAPVDFNREILPVLSDNCFHCHGPDEKARKAKLRFDTQEGAFRVRDGNAVIVPGKSAESELYRRITSADADELMPPPESNRKLSAAQIDLLKRWIDQGAKWGGHWAFSSPRPLSPPKIRRSQWPRNGIDAFVLARLEKEGLAPAVEASKELLIRRVTLDLTGLPPTPAEIDAFVADRSARAYERLVERLLNSPRYGERMASDWLDLARYADTHGFQMDRYRPTWAWRDWVIKAFNENLPYSEFLTWQLAGDLLPSPTREQRLATGFNRHHLQNEEGGIVEEEYRVAYVVDRVNTMGTAFLGLTLECARCHDHKFDPITQRDYYSLFAFFQNIDESGQTTFFTEATPVPALLLTDTKTEERLNALGRRIRELESQRGPLRDQARIAFEAWFQSRTNAPEVTGLMAAYHFDEMTSNRVANAVEAGKPATGQEGPKLVPGKLGQAVELNGENGFTFPGVGHFSRADAFSFGLWIAPAETTARSVVLHHSKAPIDAGSRGYELLLEDGHIAFGLHHMWPGNSLKVITKQSLPTNQWSHVTVTYDGSSRARGLRIYVNGTGAEAVVVRDKLAKDITYGGGEPELALGYRFRDAGFKQGRIDELRIYGRALTPLEVAHIAGLRELTSQWPQPHQALSAAQGELWLDYYLDQVYPPALRLAAELRRLYREQNDVVNPIPEAMVMEEMAKPRAAYVLKRGAYDAPGEAVTANTPGSLPPFPANQPRNRLGLARWLTASENPLTARVTVNRVWQMMFGRGLVSTSDNFGKQGAFPTHPELLDWLAQDFVQSGWDLKRLLKQIATSATYRQSSGGSASLLARDPANELLARGSVRRLTAEMLRDQALAVSGLLAEKIGGPSVKPYQPDGLWEEKAMGAPKYETGKGEDLHRRSLYTYWKRTVPHPAMIAFDAAERNVCVVQRQTTSTPLQALALLNDPQMVEAARSVAQRVLREGGSSLPDQVAWAFRAVTGRQPHPKEIQVLTELFREQESWFRAHPLAAAKYLAVGETPVDASLDLVALAAGTVLAQAVLNHDGAVMRR